MQYLLSAEEYSNLAPKHQVEMQGKAIRVALDLIVSDEECERIHYCCDCPIGQLEDREVRNTICHRHKKWPK